MDTWTTQHVSLFMLENHSWWACRLIFVYEGQHYSCYMKRIISIIHILDYCQLSRIIPISLQYWDRIIFFSHLGLLCSVAKVLKQTNKQKPRNYNSSGLIPTFSMHYFTILLTKVPSVHQGKRKISSIQLNELSYPTFRLLVTPKFTIPTKYKDEKTRVIRDYPLSASQSSSQPKVLSLVLVHVGQVSFILLSWG